MNDSPPLHAAAGDCDLDADWMRQAIALSRQSLYITTPNPRVACLIVRDGRLLASGVTQEAGGPHAEVMALRQAREKGVSTEGATFYVTLEPCSHHGRTPPCVDALIEARPGRVVVAMADPNPLVSGRGLARLKAAGIAVDGPICTGEALDVNPGFVARMTRGTPWVWLKTAASLDGRTALANGVSQWITGPLARADGHHWRARSCVVLTGAGTVLADDPLLNVREVPTRRQPVRAVIDTGLQVPDNARLFDGSPAWVFTASDDLVKARRLADRNVQVVRMPLENDRVHLPSVMRWLGEHDVNEVHVEAGSVLSGALLQAGCVDQLLVYLAPTLLGAGRPIAELPVLRDLEHGLRFEFFDTASLGADLRLLARKPEAWRDLLDSVSAASSAE